MASVDNRIVKMTFDNDKFAKKAADTMSVLDKLKEKLSFKGASKGLQELDAAKKNLNFDSMANAVENIKDKFSILGAVGFTVIQDLTRSAMGFASKISGLVLDPLVAGGKRRAENIEQAQFLFRGLGMDIKSSMDSARDAVRGTAYGLDEAAKAAAQMGGSGLRAGKEMTGALRGIAGISAMTGSSYGEMAQIFTSAAGMGKINNQQLEQFAWRGVNVAAELAKQWGVTQEAVKNMAADGEISFEKFAKGMDDAFGEHATKANETYSGSLANLRAAFSRIGATFFSVRLEQQRDLFNALAPVIDNVHDALKPLINMLTTMTGLANFTAIKKLEGINLTQLTRAINLITKGLAQAFMAIHLFTKSISIAFREVFPKSSKSKLVEIARLFKNLMVAITPTLETMISIRNVFRGVFSIFAIGIEIVKNVASAFVTVFKALDFSSFSGGSGILKFFSDFGEKIFKLKEALVDGGGIKKYFDDLVPGIAKFAATINISGILQNVSGAIKSFFGIFKSAFGLIGSLNIPGILGGIASAVGKVASAFRDFFLGPAAEGVDTMEESSEKIATKWGFLGKVASFLGNVLQGLSNIFTSITKKIKEFVSSISTGMKEADFSTLFNVGSLIAIGLLIKKVVDTVKGFLELGGENGIFGKLIGTLDSVQGMIDGVTETLSAMQAKLKSEALLNIAIAVGVLSAALFVLATIDAGDLAKALTATAVGFGQLAATMAILTKIPMGPSDAAKVNAIASALILLGAALLVFSLGVKIMSTMNVREMIKGLVGVALMLTILIVALKNMPPAKRLIRTSLGIATLGLALLILTKSVKVLGAMNVREMVQGLIGVALLLAALTVAMKNMPNQRRMMSLGISILTISIALVVLTKAVTILGNMPVERMIQGLIGVALLLAALAVAMRAMPNQRRMMSLGISILLISAALIVLTVPLQTLGNMPVERMIQGLIGVALLLAALAVAMRAMPNQRRMIALGISLNLVGAALIVLTIPLQTLGNMPVERMVQGFIGVALLLTALAVAMRAMPKNMLFIGAGLVAISIGLLMITQAVFTLGNMSLKELIKGLVAIAAVLLVLVVAANLMQGAMSGAISIVVMAGALIILATALAFIAAIGGMGLAIAILAIVAVLAILVVAGIALTPVIKVLLAVAAALLIFGLALGIIGAGVFLFAAGIWMIVKAIEAFVFLIKNSFDAVLLALKLIISVVIELVKELFLAFLEMGKELLLALPDIWRSLGESFEVFIDELRRRQPSFFKFLYELITNGLTLIRSITPDFVRTGGEVLVAFLRGMRGKIGEIVTLAIDIFLRFTNALTKRIPELVNTGAELIIAFLDGMTSKVPDIAHSAMMFLLTILYELAQGANALVDAGLEIVVKVLEGIADKMDDVLDAGANLIAEIITGIGNGATDIMNKATEMVEKFVLALALNYLKLLNAGKDLILRVLAGTSKALLDVANKAAEILIAFINGLSDAIDTHAPEIRAAGRKLAGSIADGITGGLAGKVGDVFTAGKALAGKALGGFGVGIEANSPSKAMIRMAGYLVDGLTIGLGQNGRALQSAEALGDNVLNAFQKSFAEIASLIDSMDEFAPTITPVLDLSNVKAGAQSIGDLMGDQTLRASGSFAQASLIAQLDTPGAEPNKTDDVTQPTKVEYHQTINAPKQLSTGEIYRQSKSLLILTKESA